MTPNLGPGPAFNALQEGRLLLQNAGVDAWQLEAELLLAQALHLTRAALLAHTGDILTQPQAAAYWDMLQKRAQGVPFHYIVGEKEFMSLPFFVDENVLIPRGDTEILAQQALDAIRALSYSNVLELCTGSGCIAVTLAHYAGIGVTATDISPQALAVARANARRHHVSARICFYEGDLYEALPPGRRFQLIVSNPPYIPTGVLPNLPPDVGREPRLALDGGPDGLDFYRRIVTGSLLFLQPRGQLMVECGFDQGGDIARLLAAQGFTDVCVLKDLSGLDRVVTGRWIY